MPVTSITAVQTASAPAPRFCKWMDRQISAYAAHNVPKISAIAASEK